MTVLNAKSVIFVIFCFRCGKILGQRAKRYAPALFQFDSCVLRLRLINHEGRCPEYFNRLQILYMGYFTKDDAWKITINGEEGSGSFPVPTAELESMVTTCHKRATSETSKIFQALKKTESELFFNLLEMELIRYASKKFKPGSMTTEPQTDSAETSDNK